MVCDSQALHVFLDFYIYRSLGQIHLQDIFREKNSGTVYKRRHNKNVWYKGRKLKHVIHNPTTQNSTYRLDITTLHMKLDSASLYFCPPMKQEMGLDKSIMGKNGF